MKSLFAREHRGPVRSGMVPLVALALITVCSASYCFAMRRGPSRWKGLPSAAVRRVSFDVCVTAGGTAQSSQQKVVKCQLENLRVRSERMR